MITGFSCLLATELPVSKRERERESKRDPHPRQRAPHFLGSCQALPSFTTGPSFPYHTKCYTMLSWEAWRQKETLGSFLALPKEGIPATLACDRHLHASLEHARVLHLSQRKKNTRPGVASWPWLLNRKGTESCASWRVSGVGLGLPTLIANSALILDTGRGFVEIIGGRGAVLLPSGYAPFSLHLCLVVLPPCPIGPLTCPTLPGSILSGSCPLPPLSYPACFLVFLPQNAGAHCPLTGNGPTYSTPDSQIP